MDRQVLLFFSELLDGQLTTKFTIIILYVIHTSNLIFSLVQALILRELQLHNPFAFTFRSFFPLLFPDFIPST